MIIRGEAPMAIKRPTKSRGYAITQTGRVSAVAPGDGLWPANFGLWPRELGSSKQPFDS
jgi:hypothetical protein